MWFVGFVIVEIMLNKLGFYLTFWGTINLDASIICVVHFWRKKFGKNVKESFHRSFAD